MLVQHDGEIGITGQLVADRPDAAPRRIAQPPRRGSGREQALDQVVQRRGVGDDVGVEREIAAGEHHRDAVVGDGARHEDDVAGLDPRPARQLPTGGDEPDSRRRDVHAVGGAPVDDLGVAGHDGDAGRAAASAMSATIVAQRLDREALLEHECRRERSGSGAHHREVVDRAVDREVTDRSAGETSAGARRTSRW